MQNVNDDGPAARSVTANCAGTEAGESHAIAMPACRFLDRLQILRRRIRRFRQATNLKSQHFLQSRRPVGFVRLDSNRIPQRFPATMSELRKAVIKNADMAEDMQQVCLADCSLLSFWPEFGFLSTP
jgi:hypothetical protein